MMDDKDNMKKSDQIPASDGSADEASTKKRRRRKADDKSASGQAETVDTVATEVKAKKSSKKRKA